MMMSMRRRSSVASVYGWALAALITGGIPVAQAAAVERIAAYFDGTTPSSNGWLLANIDGGQASLPVLTRVDLQRTTGGRHYFVVNEGPYRGRQGSVASTYAGQATLMPSQGHKGPVTVTYNKSTRFLTIQSEGATLTFSAEMDTRNSLPDGTYPIGLPDAPHWVPSYLDPVAYSRTWFPIITNTSDPLAGQRYLHTGTVSLGCMTVTDTARWRAAHAYLISSRKGDGRTIGVLRVVSR